MQGLIGPQRRVQFGGKRRAVHKNRLSGPNRHRSRDSGELMVAGSTSVRRYGFTASIPIAVCMGQLWTDEMQADLERWQSSPGNAEATSTTETGSETLPPIRSCALG